MKILTTGHNSRQNCILDYMGSSSLKPALKVSEQIHGFTTLESGIIDMPDASKSYTFQFATAIPCPGTPTVQYEGQVYNTIQILGQCWLKENLNAGTMVSGTIEQSNH